MHRLARRLAGALALLAFTFAQLAVAAYACPRDMPVQASAVAMDEEHAACERDRYENLCERHCDDGAAALGTSVADAPAAPPAVALRLRGLDAGGFGTQARERERHGPLAHAPPPLLLFGALRL